MKWNWLFSVQPNNDIGKPEVGNPNYLDISRVLQGIELRWRIPTQMKHHWASSTGSSGKCSFVHSFSSYPPPSPSTSCGREGNHRGPPICGTPAGGTSILDGFSSTVPLPLLPWLSCSIRPSLPSDSLSSFSTPSNLLSLSLTHPANVKLMLDYVWKSISVVCFFFFLINSKLWVVIIN